MIYVPKRSYTRTAPYSAIQKTKRRTIRVYDLWTTKCEYCGRVEPRASDGRNVYCNYCGHSSPALLQGSYMENQRMEKYLFDFGSTKVTGVEAATFEEAIKLINKKLPGWMVNCRGISLIAPVSNINELVYSEKIRKADELRKPAKKGAKK